MSLYLPASILMYFHVCSHVPSSLVFKQPKFRIVPYYWNFIKVCFLCVSQGLILRNFRSRKSPNLGQKRPNFSSKNCWFSEKFSSRAWRRGFNTPPPLRGVQPRPKNPRVFRPQQQFFRLPPPGGNSNLAVSKGAVGIFKGPIWTRNPRVPTYFSRQKYHRKIRISNGLQVIAILRLSFVYEFKWLFDN